MRIKRLNVDQFNSKLTPIPVFEIFLSFIKCSEHIVKTIDAIAAELKLT